MAIPIVVTDDIIERFAGVALRKLPDTYRARICRSCKSVVTVDDTSRRVMAVWTFSEPTSGSHWIVTNEVAGPLRKLTRRGWLSYEPGVVIHEGIHIHANLPDVGGVARPAFLSGRGLYLYSNPSGSVVQIARDLMRRICIQNQIEL
jgi:hypothetical protein